MQAFVQTGGSLGAALVSQCQKQPLKTCATCLQRIDVPSALKLAHAYLIPIHPIQWLAQVSAPFRRYKTWPLIEEKHLDSKLGTLASGVYCEINSPRHRIRPARGPLEGVDRRGLVWGVCFAYRASSMQQQQPIHKMREYDAKLDGSIHSLYPKLGS